MQPPLELGHPLALQLGIMDSVYVNRTRRKAVWGPKRTLIAALVVLLGATPNAWAKGQHRGRSLKLGQVNKYVRDYRMDDDLESLAKEYERRRDLGTTKVIIELKPGADLTNLPPDVARVLRWGHRLDVINGQVVEVPNRLLKKLAEFPGVFRVHYDRPTQLHNYRTSITVGARTVQDTLGYTGAGVGVAIIDSGITSWHDDLTNKTSKIYPYGNQRVSKFVDFVGTKTTPYDDNGHGSHVAGIIAGNGYDSNGEKSGIAPGASLVSLKVLDKNGKGSISDIIAALNWVALNAKTYNIRVVNMSVGAAVRESYWSDPLTLATKALTDKGITVVAAAGNLGKNALGQKQYGAITAPGNAPWVLTVGASSTQGTLTRSDDKLADYSSLGPTAVDFLAKPDLVAPGTGTVSLAVPGSTFYLTKTLNLLSGSLPLGLGVKPYLALSGTSMAAPVVSGTVALMLQANPNLTPNLIKAILQYTSQRYYGYNVLEQGAGFLNSYGAVRLARFYATARAGDRFPVQTIWSRHIIWGNHELKGGIMKPSANAWANNIVWGTAADGDNIVWGMSEFGDNIVWGTSSVGDNIVWGMSADGDNIVWGMDCGGGDCADKVWGSVSDGDNIVWGTAELGDNIVWGTAGFDNIVWSTSSDTDDTWGSSAGDETDVMFPDTATEPLPSISTEFGDTVPLVAPVTTTISSLLGGGL